MHNLPKSKLFLGVAWAKWGDAMEAQDQKNQLEEKENGGDDYIITKTLHFRKSIEVFSEKLQ